MADWLNYPEARFRASKSVGAMADDMLASAVERNFLITRPSGKKDRQLVHRDLAYLPGGLSFLAEVDIEPDIEATSFVRWLTALEGPVPSAVAQPEKKKSSSRSMHAADMPLVEAMRSLIASTPMSPSAAALHFVDEAGGTRDVTSRQRRLVRLYLKTYGE